MKQRKWLMTKKNRKLLFNNSAGWFIRRISKNASLVLTYPANKKTLWKRCDNVLIWLWKRFGRTFIRAFLESFLNVCKTFWYNVTKNVVKTLWQRFGTTLQKTLWKRCDNVLIWLWKSFGKTFMRAFLESFLNVCKTFWKNVAENPFCDHPATFLKPSHGLSTTFQWPF